MKKHGHTFCKTADRKVKKINQKFVPKKKKAAEEKNKVKWDCRRKKEREDFSFVRNKVPSATPEQISQDVDKEEDISPLLFTATFVAVGFFYHFTPGLNTNNKLQFHNYT